MLTKQEIHARMRAAYGPCTYDDASHAYHLGAKKLTSITTAKKHLTPPFDAAGVAAKIAAKEGRTPAAVMASWAAIRDAGTLVHELIEAILFRGEIQRPTDHAAFSAEAHARFHAYRSRGLVAAMVAEVSAVVPVAAELMLWSESYAGTADLIAYSPAKKTFHVIDWKTNAKAGFEDAWGKRLAEPFSDLGASKLAEFSIQLESYRAMLEAVGVPMGASYVVHGYFDDKESPIVDLHTCHHLAPRCAAWLGLRSAQVSTIPT